MINPRILENQRRTTLGLIDELAQGLTPGRPFLPFMRNVLAQYRGFGARDRRVYRELIFSWLRYRAWFDRARTTDAQAAINLLIALAPDTPDMAPIQASLNMPGGIPARDWPEMRARLDGIVPGLEPELEELLPAWFKAHCPELFTTTETLAQLTRPPFWLRAQRGTGADLVHKLGRDGIDAVASPRIPGAVRVRGHVDLEAHPLVTSGRAEIQDVGSQALLVMTAPAARERWLDLCAGAGGKSLQLAGLLGPAGRVVSYDVRRDALMELRRRLLRAEITNITVEPVLPEPGPAQFDGVLVDAPCSASGTWRRHPFLRHQTDAGVIARYTREQLALLRQGANYVAPGGRLIYATCSLSRRENGDVVTAFLREDREFQLEPPPFVPENVTFARQPGWVTLLPSMLDSDGYFLACMRRKQ